MCRYFLLLSLSFFAMPFGLQADNDELILKHIKEGTLSQIDALLDSTNINKIYQDSTRFGTTLINVAACSGNLPILRKLFIKGAKATVATNFTYDALKEAIDCRQANAVIWLSNSIHYSHFESVDFERLLYLAIANDDVNTFNAILNKVTDAHNQTSYSKYLFAAGSNHVPAIFNQIIKLGGNPLVENVERETLLHSGINSPEILKILFEFEIDPNAKNLKGQAPMHLCQNTESLDILIDHGAKVSIKDTYGLTPLHYAALDGDEKMVEALLINGASPMQPTENQFQTLYKSLVLPKGATSLEVAQIAMDYNLNLGRQISSFQKVIDILSDY